MMKIIKLNSLIALIAIAFNTPINAANFVTSCYNDDNGNFTTYSSVAPSANTTNGSCEGEPDYYGVTVYEMGLCSSAPTAPSSSTTVTESVANCQVVLTSPGGTLVSVSNGVTADIDAPTSRPVNGTYSYGYLIMDNTFLIKASADFGSGYTNRYCVSGSTNGTPVTNESGGKVGSCASSQSSAGTPGLTETELVNFYGTDSEGTLAQHVTATVSAFNLTAYLLNSDGNLATATTSAGVSRLMGVQTFSAPITITDDTASMDVALRVSHGTTISGWPTASIAGGDDFNGVQFDSGPFVMEISTE